MKISELKLENEISDEVDQFNLDFSNDQGDEDIHAMKVLREHPVKKVHGMRIINVASIFHSVHKDILIEDLAQEFSMRDELLAVGVVDDESEPLGIIARRELFNIIGRSYGEGYANKRSVEKIARETKSFNCDMNILSVFEEIREESKKSNLNYYLLTDSSGKYSGIFSTHDIMLFLSQISRADIEAATSLQRCIVREDFCFQEGKLSIAACSQMALGVGGDFYTVKKISSNRFFVTVADVSGKGTGASLLSAVMGGIVHAYDFTKGVGGFVKKLNEYILNSFGHEKFITGIFLDIDISTEKIGIYDMGHSYAYLLREDSFFRIKCPDNYPIGVEKCLSAKRGVMRLKKGDLVVMITDGLIEQKNRKKIPYGFNRFREIIVSSKRTNEKDILKTIKNDQDFFRCGEPRNDDLTCLVIKYNE